MSSGLTSIFHSILPILASGQIDFIVVGGGAALAHGLPRMTLDVDVVYSREVSNLERMLVPWNPIRRTYGGHLPDCPSSWMWQLFEQV